MKYACVIVTYNRKEKLDEAIQSILRQKETVTKIIIVDNASTDGTKLLMEKYQGSSVIVYHRLITNKGGAMGFYTGINDALKYDVDWISLSDDDAMYSADFFSKIAAGISRNPGVQCLTGTVKSRDGSIQCSHRKSIKNMRTLEEKNIPMTAYRSDFFLDTFTFVGAVIKKTLISTIGLPEKDFFIWKDDDEYSLRVRRHTQIKNISDAVVVHLNSNKERGFSPDWKEYYGIRNRLIIENKYADVSVQLVFKNIKFILKRFGAILLKPTHYPYIYYLTRQLVDGYIDGLKGKQGINERYRP
ncbi:glycosyltransferase [Lactiplantibacillus daoliensis]|uniref:Glycosyltransferase n=1 Tax=Lactiplantibacillus daoliensis TaxID=2559916 RepID=A0ABW1UGI2_9LACO|nr:glycosyltransferase [Lactiplantibacillus daoliensis]